MTTKASPNDEKMHWHSLDTVAIARALRVDPAQGLSDAEAEARLLAHGRNALPAPAGRGIAGIIVAQFADFMIMVLIAAAIISGLVGDAQDTIAIIVILILNAAIGSAQEYRAEKAMAALRQMAAPSARVRRDGEVLTLPAEELVPGDVVLLEAGNIVPADLRLCVAARLRVAEAALTGESHAVDKTTAPLQAEQASLGDRHNMAYKGTLVAYGRGEGVVVATGLATELGKIAALLAGEEESKTPLQKRLARFGGRIAWAVLAISAIVFAAGILRGEAPLLMLLTAVSLAVAAIPEALPAVVAISLALGAYRMSLQHALIRRLPAVETLGSVTYICTDKTGTLTQNRMSAEAFRVGDASSPSQPLTDDWRIFFQALALCNDATLGSGKAAGASIKIAGEPTEVALLEASLQHGFSLDELRALQSSHPRIAELPFDAEKKRMLTVHRAVGRDDEDFLVLVKGAPEMVLPLTVGRDVGRDLSRHVGEVGINPDLQSPSVGRASARHAGDVGLKPDLRPDLRPDLQAQAEAMAADGLRVLAIAYRRVKKLPDNLETLDQNLIFVGLVGLLDPPRREAHRAVQECRAAGITVVMITGDHPATAKAIARRLEILDSRNDDPRSDNPEQVMTGAELDTLAESALQARITDVRVFARVNPEQKIRIVKALQARGEYVAMTGDGVNDAPALRRADIGIAMGRGGTDVAREAAHLVLLDDNFASIVHAVREGRRIFDNIRKFVKYAMTGNSGEIWVIFLAPFLGLPMPLLPIHILWINLVTDGLPGLALAAEPAEKNLMQRPPRPPQESLFAGGMWQHIVWVGLLMGAVCLLLQAWAIQDGDAHWQSMVFTVLTLSQLGHALAIRSERDSLFTIGPRSNPYLAWTVGLTFLLQMATLYVPALNPIFRTEALTLIELGVCLLASTVVFFGVEAEKWLIRRGLIYGRVKGEG